MPPRRRSRKSSAYHMPSTPYKDLLYTNIAPSDDECRRIQDLLVAPTKELEDTTEEISRLPDPPNQLIHKRDALTEFIDSHLALVSPARRLPADIWREIFTACLPNEMPTMNSSKSPLLLSHVCSDWKKLAFSMPHLWASLRIEAAASWSHSDEKLLNKGLKSWLPRSGSLPLSISYTDRFFDQSDPYVLLIRTLVKSCHRWGTVRFHLPSLEDFKALGKISPDDVPLLTSVVIATDQSDPVGDELQFFDFIQAKGIRRISFHSRPDSSGRGLEDLIPWSQLQHLSLKSDITLVEALDVLRECSALETCICRIEELPTHVLPTLKPIYMERLRQLCIYDASGGNTHLFDHIVLPNLQSLEYSNEDDYPVQILSSLCAPEKLKSLSTVVSTDAFGEGLRCFPMLQKLLVHRPRRSLADNGAIACPLFKLLSPSSASAEILCPRLESICFLGLDVGSDQELLDLVHARRARDDIQRLTSLHVVFTRAQQVDVTAGLGAAGLTAALRYPNAQDSRFMIPMRRVAMKTARAPVPVPHVDYKPEEPEDEWLPISRGWLADYEDWGLPWEED
ncbi:hypothetical protein C8R44DRAFT_982371 [Mycena epipterygia]|nr:hypothetical protein C8R44DRAFT_982371 [Mycena epipterygia]